MDDKRFDWDTIPVSRSFAVKAEHTDSMRLQVRGTEEVFRITLEGRLFWKGREVETDEELRKALIELTEMLRGNYGR